VEAGLYSGSKRERKLTGPPVSFMGGETDQWNPSIYDGLTRVPTPHREGYRYDRSGHCLDEVPKSPHA